MTALLRCSNCAARFGRKSIFQHQTIGACCPICLVPLDGSHRRWAGLVPKLPKLPAIATHSATKKGRRRERIIAAAGCCAACGSEKHLTLDHIVPRSRGGSNRRENIQVLCRRCNLAKGNTMPAEAVA